MKKHTPFTQQDCTHRRGLNIGLMWVLAPVFLFSACAHHPPRAVLVAAPAPQVNSTAQAATLAAGRTKATSAATRTEDARKSVEAVAIHTDPQTAVELHRIGAELSSVQGELRETEDAFITAEAQRITAQTAADALKKWGEQQQAEAAATAEGWRACDVISTQRERHIIKLQSLIGIALGLGAGIVGLRFFGPYGAIAGPVVWGATYIFL